MYDIHCHILFGLDDEIKDIDDSIEICRTSAEQGIKAIISTPYYIVGELEPDQSSILSQTLVLNNKLENEGIELTVLPGMEVSPAPRLVELYEDGKIIPLNFKKYMLIKLPTHDMNISPYLEEILFRLQLKGITPVISHPERCSDVIIDPNIIYELIESGCIIQIDSGSIEGVYGREVQKTAYTLLKHHLAHAIATNNHSGSEKTSYLKDSFSTISKRFGQNTAENLFVNNPYKIIFGEDLIVNPPERIKPKKFWIF